MRWGNSIPGIIDITVTHSKENGRIQISVKDNGIGMSQETIQKYFSNQAIAELSEKSSMSISELRSSITAWPFSMGKIIVSRLTVHRGWERKFTLNFRSKIKRIPTNKIPGKVDLPAGSFVETLCFCVILS